MKRRLLIASIVALIFLNSFIGAAVDPAWYKITFTLGDWLSQGNKNLDDQPLSNMYLGSFGINRADGYEAMTSWKNSDKIWGSQESNLTFVLTTTTPRARLEHISKPNTNINMSYELNIGSNAHIITQTQTIATATMNQYLGSNVYTSVTMPTSQLSNYRGSYTSFLTMKIYAEYGTNNQVLLKEFTYTVDVYFKKKSQPITTNLTVNRYPSAENINIADLQQSGAYLNVGSVEFWSDDTESTSGYSLRISPKINPLIGDFTFVHASSPSSFTYKVHVPGKTQPTYKTFTVPTTPPVGNTGWSASFEIAISGVNVTNVPIAGEYTSTIAIELETN